MFVQPTGLAPNRQRSGKNLLRNYLFNGFRRLSSQAVYWVIPFGLGTSCYLRSAMSMAEILNHLYFRIRYIHLGKEL